MTEYYKGMFGSLKHNILLMLGQIEGSMEFADLDFTEELTLIQERVRQIIAKNKKIRDRK